MQIYIGFSWRFKHIKKFEAISKHRPLTGQGLQALSDNSPKNFEVFVSLILHMFRELEATAPQACYQFRTKNGTADVL